MVRRQKIEDQIDSDHHSIIVHIKSKKAEKENKRVGRKGKGWDWSEEWKKRFKEEIKKIKIEKKRNK